MLTAFSIVERSSFFINEKEKIFSLKEKKKKKTPPKQRSRSPRASPAKSVWRRHHSLVSRERE